MRREILCLVVLGNALLCATALTSNDAPSYMTHRASNHREEPGVTAELKTEVEATNAAVVLRKRSALAMKSIQDGYVGADVVDMILALRPKVAAQDVLDIAHYIARWTRNAGFRADGSPLVRPELVVALVDRESSFNPQAKSATGDHGLMQLHGVPDYGISSNIHHGVAHLMGCLNAAEGNERQALAHYNGGSNPPQRSYDYADAILKTANELRKRITPSAQCVR